MTPARTAGQHRRTGTASVAAVLDQLRQARAERDQIAPQLAAVEAERDTLRAMLVDSWRQAETDAAAAYQDGRSDEAAAAADQPGLYASDGGTTLTVPCQPWPDKQDAELLTRRWGPPLEMCSRHGVDCTGRLHFADPRPGDYMGGPVLWPQPSVAGVDVEAVAS